jgi:hypothetical protein
MAAATDPGDRAAIERRQLELDLQQARKLESVGRLASGIAHGVSS